MATGKTQNHSPKKPGGLEGETTLSLHTNSARILVAGRKETPGKTRIVGLIEYGLDLKRIWTGIRENDPWADWYLVQTHDVLEEQAELLADMKTELNRRLKKHSAVTIEPVHANETTDIKLRFANPYAYRGAYLLAQFDEVALLILTLGFVGLMKRSEKMEYLHLAGGRVRQAFQLPGQYTYKGVTRDDYEQKTQRGIQATKLMGEVPNDILTRDRVAEYAPEYRVASWNKGLSGLSDSLVASQQGKSGGDQPKEELTIINPIDVDDSNQS